MISCDSSSRSISNLYYDYYPLLRAIKGPPEVEISRSPYHTALEMIRQFRWMTFVVTYNVFHGPPWHIEYDFKIHHIITGTRIVECGMTEARPKDVQPTENSYP